MSRLPIISTQNATPQQTEILSAVKQKMGMVPNLVGALLNSPAAAQGYLGLSGTLAGGVLPARVREQIALAVGEQNACNYCVSAHAKLGQMAGLSEGEVRAARHADAADTFEAASLRLARQVVESRGAVSDADLQAARQAGLDDAALAEVVAHVAMNVYTNYFNRLAETEIDFPVAEPLAPACSTANAS